MKKCLLALLLLLFLAAEAAADAEINGVRSWTAPDRTRLVFDMSNTVEYEVMDFEGMNHVSLRMKQSALKAAMPEFESHKLIESIRSDSREGDVLVSIGLRSDVKLKSFQLDPNGPYGHRLVLDLYASSPDEAEVADTPAPAVASASKSVPVKSDKPVLTLADVRGREIIIAIDAGHGGEDSGAVGYRGTHEKKVVLQIAKKLKALVDAEPGMKGVLVRTGDYYIPLRKRMQIARKHRADFFVSIHADAFRDKRARGSSVFVLSHKGASSEAARWLANSENQADLVGGVSLDDKDNVLASVLLDLSQAATMQVSHEVAQQTAKNLGRIGKMHSRNVQKARFMVLKSPDIPSMLVETAFISNPEEEQKLRDPKHQQRIAKAVLTGIRTYFHNSPPPGTWLASRDKVQPAGQYVIAPGDTLSAIATRHEVSLAQLKNINKLESNLIRVGQVLKIPGKS
ncbi:MAG: N-acetylmuramoyl-L-alanine amidase [Chromatiales bacterium]|jgi:N-acetylmuramoyl-L-alanine amidase